MSFIKTTYTDETDLIKNMFKLYNENKLTVDLDPTYSKGVFWRNLEDPKLKFDLIPQAKGVVQSDCTNLPLGDESINSIMFDPPFVLGIVNSKKGIIGNRFSGFKTMKDLKQMYSKSLEEFYRILNKGGFVFFKCQDTVTSGKQFFTHIFIIEKAMELGFEVDDLFVYVRENAIIDPKWKKQLHAKKTHCYYLVLRRK